MTATPTPEPARGPQEPADASGDRQAPAGASHGVSGAPGGADGAIPVVHACPLGDIGTTPCCGRTPFELPRGDQITQHADAVTCSRSTACSRCGHAADEHSVYGCLDRPDLAASPAPKAPQSPAAPGHACGNCEGIDPDTCMVNPDRPRHGITQPGPVSNRECSGSTSGGCLLERQYAVTGCAEGQCAHVETVIGGHRPGRRAEPIPPRPARDADTPQPGPAATDPALLARVAEVLAAAGGTYPDADADTLAAAVLAALAPELGELLDYRNRITWETTCGGCARALDAAYEQTRRAEEAEAALTRGIPLICSDERHQAKVTALETEVRRLTALVEAQRQVIERQAREALTRDAPPRQPRARRALDTPHPAKETP